MAKSEKLDLYKEHKHEYAAPRKPALVAAGPARYLTVDGRGAPAGEEFQAKIGALYGLAFTMKMTLKFAGGQDYKVCPMEALYFGDDATFRSPPPDQWRWKLMIRTPQFIKAPELKAAKQALREKAKPPEFEQATLETLREGRCVQMLHVGPYDAEAEAIDAMRRFAADNGLEFHGPHHEIYLSDPRRVPPERLRTILRMPVRAVGS